MSSKVLILEDSATCQRIIRAALSDLDLHFASTISEAKILLHDTQGIDLFLIDVQLPDGDGFEFCELVRRTPEHELTPVFFLTHQESLADRLRAFELGADEFLGKPFFPEELAARVKVRLRNKNNLRGGEGDLVITGGNYRFDQARQKLYRVSQAGEHDLGLTPTEFKIAAILAKQAGNTVPRRDIYQFIWGERIHVGERTLDTHISNLRSKIRDLTHIVRAIENHGYAWVPKSSET